MRNLARWSVQHRRLVIVLWVVLAAGMVGLEKLGGSNYSNSFSLPGTESTHARDLLKAAAPRVSGDVDQIVIATHGGAKVTDPAVRARVQAMLSRVATMPHVGAVTSPYSPAGARQISPDRTVAYATLIFDEQAQYVSTQNAKNVISTAQAVDGPTLQVELGGPAITRANKQSVGGLGIGILAAAIVLILVFGSLLAAGVTLLSAGFALVAGNQLMAILSKLITMPEFSSQLALLIGLGVGVDYGLFIVTRYRQAMMRGQRPQEAVIEAVDTSGRAVLFAGMTVCIALLGMIVLGLSFLSGVGIAAAVVVGFTVLAALTLLPALLGFAGTRVLGRRTRRAITAGKLTADDESPAWARWSRLLQRRPALFAAGAAILMILISIPTFSIRLGSSDAGSDPASTTTRKAYDILARGFGPGFNGPLQLVARVSSPGQVQQFRQVLAAVGRDADVVSVAPPRLLPGGVAVAQVFEKGSPQDASTTDLINNLRGKVIPAASQGRVHVLVGGTTALIQDFSDVLSSKMPLFITVVVLLSFLLLMAVFRSIVIPLMAAAMNLLSVLAGFGVVVAVFQWGWLASLIGVDRTGPIAAFLPVIVFAILFGLSMDYEVFLVSRIYEEWHRRRNNAQAVTHGLAATGRTITAAATIMVLVFAAFVLGGEVTIKLFGVGLASAVLLDALIVRSVLVPCLMLLIGERTWAIPARIDRILPHLNVEGQSTPEPAEELPRERLAPEPQPA